jgi:hypothetical protein
MQNGSLIRAERQTGPDVWEFRWRELAGNGNPHFNLVGWTAPLYGFGISACV